MVTKQPPLHMYWAAKCGARTVCTCSAGCWSNVMPGIDPSFNWKGVLLLAGRTCTSAACFLESLFRPEFGRANRRGYWVTTNTNQLLRNNLHWLSIVTLSIAKAPVITNQPLANSNKQAARLNADPAANRPSCWWFYQWWFIHADLPPVISPSLDLGNHHPASTCYDLLGVNVNIQFQRK